MLSILYLPKNQETSMLKSYIGVTEGMEYPQVIPTRNYDDVLDAWELLWKTGNIGRDEVDHAWITQGGEWNGKFAIGGNTSMARVHYWDQSKPKDLPPVDVLGPFWIGHWNKTPPEAPVVDDLGIAESDPEKPKAAKEKKEKKSSVKVRENGTLTKPLASDV